MAVAMLAVVATSIAGCAIPMPISVPGLPGAAPEKPDELPMVRLDVEADDYLEEALGTYVVIDLQVNELRFMHGETVLWAGPVGTGTGLRLMGDDGEWHFTTPQGVFQVQYKEEDPVWIAPDWFFLEQDLPVPPRNHPSRRIPGGLGVAAVYLGEEIAIHGTDKPELLGQRVSHGCIRLSDADAQRLFHNVQIGTPVVIIGGEDLEPIEAASMDLPPAPKAPDLSDISTESLLAMLDFALANPDSVATWTYLTSELISRGLVDDAIALRGVIARAGTAATEPVRHEYATFVADAFARGSLRAVVSLARIDEEARKRGARAIVEATMSLHSGAHTDDRAPWPTRRLPPGRLGPDGTTGWEAIRAAEAEYRETYAARRDESGRRGSR
ncbi:MAG TPA: L,D-transpeptidase [Longimicrobiaceae bacterium]|nr:L,D-transpeptidase [Longimicrobiaceae bacterium]